MNSRRRSSWLVGLLVSWPTLAPAGLVLDLSPEITARDVASAQVAGDTLRVQPRTGAPVTLHLVPGALAHVVDWSTRYVGGPLQLSIDGALAAGGQVYFPPSMPAELAERLLHDDVYLHAISCGGRPPGGHHPLPEADMPDVRYRALLDPGNPSAEAWRYRHLAARYVGPPECIGDFHLYVIRGDGASRIRLRPMPWLHTMTQSWYRGRDVPGEWDRWAGRIPYRPLTEDIGAHWPRYRAAYTRLDEFSAIVEAMAWLAALRRDARTVHDALVEQSRELPRRRVATDDRSAPAVPAFDSTPWRATSERWIGETVDTSAEANLALALIVARGGRVGEGPPSRRDAGIAAAATGDRRFAAKLSLHRALWDARRGHLDEARLAALLADLRSPVLADGFRLRASAVRMLRAEVPPGSDSARRLDLEAQSLLLDFARRADARCDVPSSPAESLLPWEDLVQDVYSVDLLEMARRSDSTTAESVVLATACVHLRRGLAHQVGWEFGVRHAHYRFLGYLRGLTHDPQTRVRIDGYRQRLAAATGVPDWKEDRR